MLDPMTIQLWPDVPKADRPKKLYHCGLDTSGDACLIEKGWAPIDVRLMPNKTDGDRAERLKAMLEGIALGSIEPDPKAAKFVELELRVYKLTSDKVLPAQLKTQDAFNVDDDVEDVLKSFSNSRPWSTSADEKEAAIKKRRGRPEVE